MIWDEEEEDDKEVQELEENEEEEEEKHTILSPKLKIITLIKDKYYSIKNAIKNNTYKLVQENFNKLAKKIDKINSLLKKEEIPSCYYECFVLVEEVTNLPKEEQKQLAKYNKENDNSINSLKKFQVRIMKKLGQSIVEYKKNRKSEEELEKDLENIISKFAKKKDDKSDDEIDIIELMRRDEKEKKNPDLRRLKWVKKKK